MTPRKPRRRPAAAAKPAPWGDTPTVVCTGGPMAGHWFFAHDWQQRVTAARRMRDAMAGCPDARRSLTLDYVLTERRELHPEFDVEGLVLAYAGDEQPAEVAR